MWEFRGSRRWTCRDAEIGVFVLATGCLVPEMIIGDAFISLLLFAFKCSVREFVLDVRPGTGGGKCYCNYY